MQEDNIIVKTIMFQFFTALWCTLAAEPTSDHRFCRTLALKPPFPILQDFFFDPVFASLKGQPCNQEYRQPLAMYSIAIYKETNITY